ncbi:hypothetical protein [Aquibacillus sediminis]|uniref:hypothetical protein n=1 Tax=Aquibacillus sediminis TaxID=2574734 RepID=UPI001108DD39|nr:hypothetical protein [Aquibacillus sediminis]
MSEEKLDRIEKHMEQLMKMVAENNKMVTENNKVVTSLSERMDQMEKSNAQRHKEIIKELRNHTAEIDYLREQVSKHDMAIHKLETSSK